MRASPPPQTAQARPTPTCSIASRCRCTIEHSLGGAASCWTAGFGLQLGSRQGGGRHAVRCCLPAATAGDADVPTGGASLWFVVGGRSRVPTIRPAVGQSERGRLGQGTEEEENKTECRCALWPSDGWAAPAGRSRANSKEISLAHENLRRV